MIEYFRTAAAELEACVSPAELRLNLMSTLRLLLQHVCYSALEWLVSRAPPPDAQPDPRLLQSLRQPSDGTLVDAMPQLLYWCERNGWMGAAQVAFRQFDPTLPASRLCVEQPTSLDGLLRSLVTLRNDGGEGHGLTGGFDPVAERSALEVAIELLEGVIPRSEDQQILIAGPDTAPVRLTMLRMWGGRPVLVRKVQPAAGQKIRISAQLRIGMNEREDLTYEASDPFSKLVGNQPPSFAVWPEGWRPYIHLPDRLTDTFTGRESELSKLAIWADDDDSRTCLVYGDGGLGKTTLVLEFLHRWLDGAVQTAWKPAFVTFYTAKRWRWGIDGIEVLKPGVPNMMDLVTQLHRLFFDAYPGPEWYRLDLSAAIQKLAGLIREQHKTSRDEHLIVIDNAETLIDSEDNREQLATELREVSRRLGRVILTSRRREYLEASPIEIRSLSEDEAVTLLRERGAKKLKLRPVQTASAQELLETVKQLERRPLVLDAFLRSLTDPTSNTLRKAVSRVNAMLSRDLGRFLFGDAWGRLDEALRRLLVVMTAVADVHDATLFRICCDRLGVAVGSAERALDESGGIASVSRIGGEIQIEFSSNFVGFARSKRDAGIIVDSVLEGHVQDIKRRYADYMRSARLNVGNRFSRALRHASARAAHLAQKEGRIEDAQRYFEEAVLSDSGNGWLFERYADFLFRELRHLEAARLRSMQATELLRDESEPWFTRGMIEARLGLRQQFEGSFAKAEALGASRVRCALQMAWGYTRCKPPQPLLAEKQLEVARRQSETDRFFQSTQVEIHRVEDRIQYLHNLQTRRASGGPNS